MGFVADITPTSTRIAISLNGQRIFVTEHDRGLSVGLTPMACFGRGFVGVFNFGRLTFPPDSPYTTIREWMTGRPWYAESPKSV